MSETKEITALDYGQVCSLADEHRDNGSGTAVRSKQPNETFPAVRRRLPDERHSLTHHFSVGGQEGYVTVGLHEDGAPGEMFIRMAKEGSTVSGLMASFATAVSLALQYG